MADAPVPEKNQGNFFAVDRTAWSHVCALGSMSAAVAYLVLARGTQGDMRTTSWSVNAIEDRTAIPRLRAKHTIKALIEGQVIEQRKGGTKPQYYLLPPAAIENRRNPTQALTPEEEQVLAVITAHPGGIEVPTGSRRKEPWPFGSPQTVVSRLCQKGRARYIAGSWSKVVPVEQPTAAIDSDWIWLPNTIVDGADGEVPPLERVRQSQNLAALRLFVDLYHAQSLATDGGVHWRQVRQDFNRKKVGEWSSYVVWAFWPGGKTAWGNLPFVQAHMTGQEEKVERADGTHEKRDAGWPAFWAAMGVLTSTGLVEFVPHVVDADSDEGTVLHPLAGADQGEEIEREVTVTARGAGLAMLNAVQLEWATTHQVHIVPIQKHIAEVQVVGLARLRHRAKTTATALWFERMGEWSEQATRYRELEASAAGLASGRAA